jgi:replicative DNA helicase
MTDDYKQTPLPQSPEAERSVVGSILIDPGSAHQVVGWLRPTHFWDKRIAAVYQAITEMLDDDQPIDLLTVKDHLRGSVDPAFMSSLVDGIPDIANVATYGRLVKRDSDRRTAITLCEQSHRSFWLNHSVHESAGKLLDAAAELVEGSNVDSGNGTQPVPELVRGMLANLERRMSGHVVETNTIPTGFRALDAHIGGWPRGVLSIVAGLASSGKTAWVLNSAISMASQGHSVLLFSLDMPKELVSKRISSMVAGIDAAYLNHGTTTGGLYSNLSEDEVLHKFDKAARQISEWPGKLDINDNAMDLSEIMAECRMRLKQGNLDVIVVDFIQSLGSTGFKADSEHRRITEVMNKLNVFARKNNVAIILVSQFNRTLQRGERPTMRHLAESSSLDRLPRLILILDRPGFSPASDKLPCDTTLIVEKASEHGPRDIPLHFVGHCYTFEEFPHGEQCAYWSKE